MTLRINNYNNWTETGPDKADYPVRVAQLGHFDRVVMTEQYAYKSGIGPSYLRQINLDVKVFQLYGLICKSAWESDWNYGVPKGSQYLQTPLSYNSILNYDWWLRDGNGAIVKEHDKTWLLDVGKPGVKEALLDTMLRRLEGSGYDGVVLDYHGADGGTFKWITGRGLPSPVDYPTYGVWAEKAVSPVLLHITDGLRAAGYSIIGNCAGEYGTTVPIQKWFRPLLDGVVYELWILNSDGTWKSKENVARSIAAFGQDPLECWTAEYGLSGPGSLRPTGVDPLYEQKMLAGMAMYYIALPTAPLQRFKRFYGQYKNSKGDWEPLYHLDIGEPTSPAVGLSSLYAWSRKFVDGMVLLNYEDQPVNFPLGNVKYQKLDGTGCSTNQTVAPKTGAILRRR